MHPHEVVIVSAARTPIGRYGGSFRNVHPAELGAVATRAAMEQGGLAADAVDEVLMGHGRQAGSGPNPARQVGAAPGCPTRCRPRPSTRPAHRACRPSRRRAIDHARRVAGRGRGRDRVDEPDAVPDRLRGRPMGSQDGELHPGGRHVSRRVHLLAERHDHGRDGRAPGAEVRHQAARPRKRTRSRPSVEPERRSRLAAFATKSRRSRSRTQRDVPHRSGRASASRHDDRIAAQAASRVQRTWKARRDRSPPAHLRGSPMAARHWW